VIALLKQDWCVINEDSVEDWMETDLILRNVWFDLVGKVVVYRVTHVVGSEEIFEAILVDYFVLENFNKHIKTSLLFICVESDLENSIHSTLVVHLVLLVG
jgi:hypothetical protein